MLFEDNQSCIHLIKNPQQGHQRTKHIQVKYHYVRELVRARIIEIDYKKTHEQVADILTKGLAKTKFEGFRADLGLTRLSGSVE